MNLCRDYKSIPLLNLQCGQGAKNENTTHHLHPHIHWDVL